MEKTIDFLKVPPTIAAAALSLSALEERTWNDDSIDNPDHWLYSLVASKGRPESARFERRARIESYIKIGVNKYDVNANNRLVCTLWSNLSTSIQIGARMSGQAIHEMYCAGDNFTVFACQFSSKLNLIPSSAFDLKKTFKLTVGKASSPLFCITSTRIQHHWVIGWYCLRLKYNISQRPSHQVWARYLWAGS